MERARVGKPSLAGSVVALGDQHEDIFAIVSRLFNVAGCHPDSIPHSLATPRVEILSDTCWFSTISSDCPLADITELLTSCLLVHTDRSFVTGLHGSQMERQPSVDWYKVWLGAHSQSSAKSNGLPTYQQQMLVPRWPFSNEFQVAPQ